MRQREAQVHRGVSTGGAALEETQGIGGAAAGSTGIWDNVKGG